MYVYACVHVTMYVGAYIVCECPWQYASGQAVLASSDALTWYILLCISNAVGLCKLLREEEHRPLQRYAPVVANVNCFRGK